MRWQTTQVIPSSEAGWRLKLLVRMGSSRCMPTWVWQRMQKSPLVPEVALKRVACMALNTGLTWE